MKPSISLLPLALLSLFVACQKDNSFEEPSSFAEPLSETKSYTNVPPLLWDYFQRFEEAALLRGEVIDLNNKDITAEIMEISDDGVAGTCTYSSHAPNHIVIDEAFFNQTSDLYKEMVIFHELGHCVLFRGHRETRDQHGNCVSIMRSGVEGCRDNYRSETRAAYLNELFALDD